MTSMPGMVRRPAGEALRILFNAEESAGTVGVVEMIMDPGMSGPPLHVHPTHAEAFYVVSGELSFQARLPEWSEAGRATRMVGPAMTPPS